jgi:phage-related protein
VPRCTVLTYQTAGGNAPVDEYIAGLEGTAATKAAALVKLLEALGHELRLPQSRSLGEGLYELRDVGTGVRLFYVLLRENRAVLLDGMTKKRDDIPDATMKRLRALQAAVNAELKKPKKGR